MRPKADKRSRIQEIAISAEAVLPGGPYDLWREDEPSRRVKDLVGAFAENPKLPKMPRRKEILDTIDNGVQAGIFVAALTRPDKSVKTWWRTRIDDLARGEPALEVFLPEKATLTELHPGMLAYGALPSLWTGESITVADVVAYFAGGRTVTVQREGYDEPVHIPACPQAAVETAIADAGQQGIPWLLNGPASFQGEPVPAGVLTTGAQLRAAMLPVPVHRLAQDALSDAWRDGQTTALALSVALSGHIGRSVPWSVMRQAIDAAMTSRWLELAPGSGPWPCEVAGAAAVMLKQLSTGGVAEPPTGGVYEPQIQGIYRASGTLDPSAFQDLVEMLPDLIKIAAGTPLKFMLSITLGDGQDLSSSTIESVNHLLATAGLDLRLT